MSGKRIMAGRLLYGTAAALLMGACLIPQDDQVLPDLPAQKNRPLRIVTELTVPSSPASPKLGTGCPRPDFRVVVDDPDVGDLIRNKWFVDDDPLATGGLAGATLGPANDAGMRPTPVQPPSTMFSATSVFATQHGKHKLTVVVADGEFEVGSIPFTRQVGVLPDGGPLLNQAFTDAFTWDVDTSDGTPCP